MMMMMVMAKYNAAAGIRVVRTSAPPTWRTEELTSMLTRSMQSVGTSAIMTRRSALATDTSVSERTNWMKSSWWWWRCGLWVVVWVQVSRGAIARQTAIIGSD